MKANFRERSPFPSIEVAVPYKTSSKIAIENGVEKRGSSTKLSSAQRRALIQEACKRYMHASGIKKVLNLPVTVRRIQQILNESTLLVYEKMVTVPYLLERHRLGRLEFSRDYMDWEPKKWN